MRVRWLAGSGGAANSYICGSVLVDAGVLPTAVAPYSEEIKVIMLTHGHYDHTAHVEEIKRMCGAEVCIHPLHAPALTDDLTSVSMLFAARPPGAVADFTVDEGDRVGNLTVLHTPGHTPGGICLYLKEERVLF
ncbi:MAG TPA: MBL fold metallo-hydrolase, partial [Methanomicrobiales archaeon]|nr:MBL fold metallo-hydrolase [Methanomicrobiales archaeon]